MVNLKFLQPMAYALAAGIAGAALGAAGCRLLGAGYASLVYPLGFAAGLVSADILGRRFHSREFTIRLLVPVPFWVFGLLMGVLAIVVWFTGPE
jgi:hypothetical protein